MERLRHRLLAGLFAEATKCSVSGQTLREEIANVFTHRIGLQISIAALVVLVALAATFGTAAHIVAACVFGSFLTLMFLASTLYHGCAQATRKRFYRVLDHAAIFLLIAASYTPFMLVLRDSSRAQWLFGVIWAIAVIGVVLKLFFTGRFRALSTALYLGMGWLGALVLGPLQRQLHPAAFELLVAGGVAYSVGVIFYAWKRLPYNHAIWHLFVMTGASCHYFSVLTVLVSTT